MSDIEPLLLEVLNPGTRVRARFGIHYMLHTLDIEPGELGTVRRSIMPGLSVIEWDKGSRWVQTSHESLEVVE